MEVGIGASSFLVRERRTCHDRVRHRRRGCSRDAGDRRDSMEQRLGRASPGIGEPDAGGALTKAPRVDRGLVTPETTFAITNLPPPLFLIPVVGAPLER